MKISNNQMFRVDIKWALALVLSVLFMGASQSYAQEGESLFKAKCATCHQVFKDMTGPKLYEVRKKWEDGGAKEGSVIQWVQNWQKAVAMDPYAKQVSTWSPTAMSVFADLTDEQVVAIFDYVDAQEEKVAAAPGAPVEGVGGTQEEESLSFVWLILGAIFIVIILSVGGVRRQLKLVAGESEDTGLTYAQEFKAWAWKYRLYVGLGSAVIVIALIVGLFLTLYSVNVMTEYQPSQPIDFPHSKHAGLNGIDCKYCHNSVEDSKTAGLPTVNVCMNCHKQVQGSGEQVAKIQKIYDAAGFSPEGGGQYSGKTEPIVWNKVHNLPDHVYFNHSQHVKVGGVDCKQCHGDMTKQVETARVVPVEELSEIEGNIKLTKPTLTMGWCIECHGAKEISGGPLAEGVEGDSYYDEIHRRLLNNDKSLYEGYLEDGKVTVKELGGWECAKCHY